MAIEKLCPKGSLNIKSENYKRKYISPSRYFYSRVTLHRETLQFEHFPPQLMKTLEYITSWAPCRISKTGLVCIGEAQTTSLIVLVSSRVNDSFTPQASWAVPGVENEFMTSSDTVFAHRSAKGPRALSRRMLWRAPLTMPRRQVADTASRVVVNTSTRTASSAAAAAVAASDSASCRAVLCMPLSLDR
mmetsp:Transcript_6023/g.9116  ORF Transcript_6023/g.9116 Transcript_6023/m.9116 type:complete len:189 (-) Transcript_6023:718-1284(-)